MKAEMENVRQSMQTLSTKYGQQLCVLAEDISMVRTFRSLYIRAEAFDSGFDQHGQTESNFRRQLRWSNEHYSLTKSNHGSNRVDIVKQGRIMSRTGSSHVSNTVES